MIQQSIHVIEALEQHTFDIAEHICTCDIAERRFDIAEYTYHDIAYIS